MGLTSWKGQIVRKGDVIIAKNYLEKDEIDDLNRLVDIFLTSAELRVKERQDLTLQFWRDNVDGLLFFQNKPVLKDKGRITSAQMELKVKQIYDEFNERRKKIEAHNADLEDRIILDDLGELDSYMG